jgi:hypothetical protein
MMEPARPLARDRICSRLLGLRLSRTNEAPNLGEAGREALHLSR